MEDRKNPGPEVPGEISEKAKKEKKALFSQRQRFQKLDSYRKNAPRWEGSPKP
jgi:hypothetical protein